MGTTSSPCWIRFEDRARAQAGREGKCSNEAGGWRMAISPSTAPRERAPPGAHRRHSALSDTVVDPLVVSRGGIEYGSLNGMPSILCGALRPRSCVSRWAWVWSRSFVLLLRLWGEFASSVSTASIRHPSVAPDIYGTLPLSFRTQRSTTLDSVMPFSD
ncbi:hypothetical protein C8R45DRAFT_1183493 [Mycena sanguinolenta]|nr:hypothetical protein C8R45DRAFT_1183493 [Mycena sanguinolenta]